MHVSPTPTFDPRRALAVLPPAEQPRIVAQRRALQDMWGRLKADAKLATVMLNPIFAPHAHAIAVEASARAVVRYETEVPRKSLQALMAEEQAQARQQILGLPQRYASATYTAARKVGEGAMVVGGVAVAGAVAAGDAVKRGAEYAADQTADATGFGLSSLGRWLGKLAEKLSSFGRALAD